MLVEVDNTRILTDPGSFSNFKQDNLQNIDLILITHEHGDHLHIDSLRNVLKGNPDAKIITNSGVGKLLDAEGIDYEVIEHMQSNAFAGLQIEGFGEVHAEIYGDFGIVNNTGYFIANKFFYPGDALTNPHKPIELLALPVVGPWLASKNCVDFAKEVKPKKAFPVHDGFLEVPGPFQYIPQTLLTPEGIEFIPHDNLKQDLVIEL